MSSILDGLRETARNEITPEAFNIFRNALVYSVCSEVVRNVMGTNDSTSLVILIIIVTFFIQFITKMAIEFNVASKVYAKSMLLQLLNFIGITMLNVVVQFASTLIAQVTVTILSPGSRHVLWVALLAVMSLTLLWLFNATLLSVSKNST